MCSETGPQDRDVWRFANLVMNAVPGHRDWLHLGPVCACASETHEQVRQRDSWGLFF